MRNLFVMITILLLLLTLTACSPGWTGPAPGDAVSNFLSYIQEGEYEEAHGLILGDAPFSLYEIEEGYRGIFESLSYDNIRENIRGSRATVTLTVNAVDFAAIMDIIMAEVQVEIEGFYRVFNEVPEDLLIDITGAMLVDKMTSYTSPRIISEVTVNLEISEGRWKILADYSLADAVTGGMISFVERIGQAA